MEIKYTAKKTHKNAFSFGNLIARVFSAFLLVVVFVSPLAPAFASEDASSIGETMSSDSSADTSGSDEAALNESEADTTHSDATEPSSEESAPVEVSVTEDQSPETLLSEEDHDEDVDPATQSVEDSAVPEAEVAEGSLEEDAENVENVPADETGSAAVDTNLEQQPDSTDVQTEADPNTESTSAQDLVDTVTDTVSSTSSTIEDVTATTTPITEASTEVVTQETDLVAPDPATSTDATVVEPSDSGTTSTPNTPNISSSNFNFSKNQCVPTGDGSFYCTRPTEEIPGVITKGVYARPDTEGDKEIYIERNGVVKQITDNAFDDNAPYHDPSTNTIVWHRLIEGRYQIMSYDLALDTETQITFDRYNNMEPQRFGESTVWQGWIGNDWEIFMLTGDSLLMLTDNTIQDITPSINGDHIVWQSFEENAWRMKVYDVRTKQVETIEDSAGGSIQNPRFVLVYDTKFASGDVETRGYDLRSGEVVFLDSEPAPLPEEIPDPEQTGEERALVVPPPQPKAKVESEDDLDTSASGTGPNPNIDTDEDDLTLVIPGTDDASDLVVATSSDIIDTDLVIDSVVVETPAQDVSHIEDLVVLPYVPEKASADSQEAIEPVE